MYRARAKTKVREKRNNKSRKSGDNNNDGCIRRENQHATAKTSSSNKCQLFSCCFYTRHPIFILYFFRILCAIELFFCIPIVSQLFRW